MAPQVDVAEQVALAKKVVYDRLAVQARSRADLEQALAKKHVPAEIASEVLDRFAAAGLIDDREFARTWVESRQRSKGLSSRMLANELRRHGVAEDIAAEVLADLDPEFERAAAHELVRRKLRSMSHLDDTTRIRRLTGMLARKGYAPQVAFDVVRSELGAEPEPLESM